MQRIILPLAMIAVLYFAPLYTVVGSTPDAGSDEISRYGSFFLGNAVDCMTQLKAPIGEECGFDKDFFESPFVGHAINLSMLLAIGAAVLGVVGLLPVIGRLTSIVALAAGLAMLGSMGAMTLTLMGTDAGLGAIQWGVYATAGLALLTVIAGLGGMRGNR